MRPWKISRKLVAVFLVVTLAPLALLAVVVERHVTRAFTERTEASFDAFGAGLGRELDGFLDAHMERLALISSRTQLRQSLDLLVRGGDGAERARVERILADALDAVQPVHAVAVLGPDGEAIATVARGGGIAPIARGLASIERPGVVGIAVGAGCEPALRVAAPMAHEGRAVGVLVLDASVEPVRAMMLARIGVGASARALVRERTDAAEPRTLFVACNDARGVPRWDVLPQPAAPPARAGADLLVSARTIDRAGWESRVEMSRSEALSAPSRLRALIRATFVGVALLAVAVGWFVSRRFLRPVERLVGVTDRIRRGDLDARADESRGDELGALAASFNQMAAELVERNRELEHEVDERQRVELELARLARQDGLTSLPNRASFDEFVRDALARLARRGGFVAVLFVDIDHFKVVNDGYGHSIGDELLRAVAQRMRAALRPTDRLARIGGDEFMVLLEELAARQDAVAVAQRLHSALDAPFQIGGRDIAASASIGVACCGDPERSVDALLSEADAAMYQAKRRGRARTEEFDESMRRAALAQAQIGHGLRGSIERGELDLVYQPQIDLRTGRMCAVEALLRWRHPKLGSLSASSFIEMAESSGAIVPIGEWVAREACARAVAWRAAADHDFHVSINLSAREVTQPELVERIAATLAERHCPPEALVLEITESALMVDPEVAFERLRRLSELGVRLCVDDFGTGYSSLVYLRDLPLQGLKIDGSFVAGLGTASEDAKIVDSTIRMAHALGLRVVAEGVETRAQQRELEGFGCDVAQGFFFSRPLRAEAIDRLVAEARAG